MQLNVFIAPAWWNFTNKTQNQNCGKFTSTTVENKVVRELTDCIKSRKLDSN